MCGHSERYKPTEVNVIQKTCSFPWCSLPFLFTRQLCFTFYTSAALCSAFALSSPLPPALLLHWFYYHILLKRESKLSGVRREREHIKTRLLYFGTTTKPSSISNIIMINWCSIQFCYHHTFCFLLTRSFTLSLSLLSCNKLLHTSF